MCIIMLPSKLGVISSLHTHFVVKQCGADRHFLRSKRGCVAASRHRDGVWRSADEVPQGPGGRPLAFIAVNGHGAYPVAGTIPRIFYAVWPSSRCPPPARHACVRVQGI